MITLPLPSGRHKKRIKDSTTAIRRSQPQRLLRLTPSHLYCRTTRAACDQTRSGRCPSIRRHTCLPTKQAWLLQAFGRTHLFQDISSKNLFATKRCTASTCVSTAYPRLQPLPSPAAPPPPHLQLLGGAFRGLHEVRRTPWCGIAWHVNDRGHLRNAGP